MQGYLTVFSKKRDTSVFGGKLAWRRKYFSLNGNRLVQSRSQGDLDPEKTFVIPLGSGIVPVGTFENVPNAFMIEAETFDSGGIWGTGVTKNYEGRKGVVFGADSEEEMGRWMDALRRSLETASMAAATGQASVAAMGPAAVVQPAQPGGFLTQQQHVSNVVAAASAPTVVLQGACAHCGTRLEYQANARLAVQVACYNCQKVTSFQPTQNVVTSSAPAPTTGGGFATANQFAAQKSMATPPPYSK